MPIWFAMIVAPLLALGDQGVAFALVGWACAHQNALPLHASHAAFLAITTVAALAARRAWRETAVVHADPGDAAAQRHFLAGVAMTIAVLSAAAIVAMWIAVWMIPSCIT